MSPQMRSALGLPPSALSGEQQPAEAAPASAEATLPALAVTLRVQRRLAIRTMSILIGALLLAPLLLAVLPGLARLHIGAIPLVWILLGVLAYPALLLLAHHHRRTADRLEAALALRDDRAAQ